MKGDIIMGRMAKQVTIFDADTGEVINDTVSYGTQNGGGWVIVYKDTIMNLAQETTNPSVLRVFLSLMSKQEFEHGVRTTKKAIAEGLSISYDSVMVAFKWLKENGYIKERKVNGQTEFLLNPDVTTCGKNKKLKVELWNSV